VWDRRIRSHRTPPVSWPELPGCGWVGKGGLAQRRRDAERRMARRSGGPRRERASRASRGSCLECQIFEKKLDAQPAKGEVGRTHGCRQWSARTSSRAWKAGLTRRRKDAKACCEGLRRALSPVGFTAEVAEGAEGEGSGREYPFNRWHVAADLSNHLLMLEPRCPILGEHR